MARAASPFFEDGKLLVLAHDFKPCLDLLAAVEKPRRIDNIGGFAIVIDLKTYSNTQSSKKLRHKSTLEVHYWFDLNLL